MTSRKMLVPLSVTSTSNIFRLFTLDSHRRNLTFITFMIYFLQIQIYFSQKLYIVLKVTTTYFNNLIGILVHVGKSSNIVIHFDTVSYSLTGRVK
jgi:hypothetical protein